MTSGADADKSRPMQRLGVLGGTFDPIHLGHLALADEVCTHLNLDRVIFVPAGVPPHKSAPLLNAHHRLELVRLAVGSDPRFEVSEVEIGRAGPSYMIDTLETLQRERPQAEWFLILGLDAFLPFESWRAPERISAIAHLVVVSRPGCRFRDLEGGAYTRAVPTAVLDRLDQGQERPFDFPLASGRRLILMPVTPHDVSATAIRAFLSGHERRRNLLPAVVESYIIGHNLYR